MNDVTRGQQAVFVVETLFLSALVELPHPEPRRV